MTLLTFLDYNKFALYQTFRSFATLPDVNNLQSWDTLYKTVPLRFSAFFGADQTHHDQIKARSLPVRASSRHNKFVYQQLAIAVFHSVAGVRKNHLAFVARPVVQARVYVVGTGAYY
jgi:hypothetical protein